jgi:signal transduction histidine kinase
MAVTPTQVSARGLVDNILSQLAIEIQQKNLHVRNDLRTDATIWGDKDQLEVVIRNVLTNAIKFTPTEGMIKIFGEANSEFLQMTFQDSGVGMSDEQLNNLFEPGLHSSTTGTNQEKGTGIGLIITKELIANNGGTIQVTSRKNEGTAFVIAVPTRKK